MIWKVSLCVVVIGVLFAFALRDNKTWRAISGTIAVLSGIVTIVSFLSDVNSPVTPQVTYYRYRELQYTTSTSQTLDGWDLYDTISAGDGFTPWSGWQVDPVTPTNKREVETRTTYRCRNVVKTAEYGEWTGWSPDRISNLDATTQEESRTVQLYGYYYFECPSCHAHIYGWEITCPKWSGGCGSDTIPESAWHQMYSEISWTDANLKDWGGTGKYATDIFGERYFKWDKTRTETQYRYRTVNTKEVCSEWSPYTPQVIVPSEALEVQPRTEYRYRDIADATIYMFRRWSPWSEWTESKMEPTDTVQVESITK